MTDQHPITPPPELVEQWRDEALNSFPDDENPCPCDIDDARDEYIATQAARWSADQELEACCAWLRQFKPQGDVLSAQLLHHRRPKPQSLAEKSLDLIDKIQSNKKVWQIEELDMVRRALERLQELEGQA